MVGSLAAGGGAAWPASSSAVAHRRGPLPAAPMPRTRPQRTPRRNASVSAALRELVGPVVSRQVRRSPGERSQARGQNAAHCPGRPLRRQGRSLRSRRQGDGRKRLPLSAGDLCRPSGPDGEGQARGQARKARGESAVSAAAIVGRSYSALRLYASWFTGPLVCALPRGPGRFIVIQNMGASSSPYDLPTICT